jgi:hypothetical protein
MTRLIVALALALVCAACYGAAHPRPPKAELPPLADGATLDIDVGSMRYWSDSRLRYITDHQINRMSYNNIPLTYHEARSLADPSWEDKLTAYDGLVKRCRRANVPRYLGFTGVVAGAGLYIYGGALFQENGRLQQIVSTSVLAFGLASYAAGYYLLGGRACHEAEEVYKALHLGAAGESKIYNDDLMVEVGHIAKAFNKRMARAAKQEAAP